MKKERLCDGCDQPMLPHGVKKKPHEYDHAQGCPFASGGETMKTFWEIRYQGLPIQVTGGGGYSIAPWSSWAQLKGMKRSVAEDVTQFAVELVAREHLELLKMEHALHAKRFTLVKISRKKKA